jgi:hypothetical protein
MSEEFDEVNDDYADDFLDELLEEEMSEMIKTAAKSANKLTAIIVENNRHNSVKMSEEDIYRIFANSFTVAMATISPFDSE